MDQRADPELIAVLQDLFLQKHRFQLDAKTSGLNDKWSNDISSKIQYPTLKEFKKSSRWA
jgi:hypothetical protein